MRRRIPAVAWLLMAVGLVTPLAIVGFLKWREAGMRGGQQPAEPFRIAGNLYYVGANDVTSFLITGPDGHVLIDGGYPRTPALIMASITKLGFDIRDVKILLNTVAHGDHAGGLAELQKASGAELWASDPSADVIASGGDDPSFMMPLRALVWTGLFRYPPARVDHRVKDGETIRLGPIAVTAHLTPGPTRGCTSWSFRVRDGDRELNVVDVCGIAGDFLPYPGSREDYERSFRVLRSLPVDIWMTTNARPWGRYRKFLASANAADPVAPFIDREGYLRYIDDAEARFRR